MLLVDLLLRDGVELVPKVFFADELSLVLDLVHLLDEVVCLLESLGETLPAAELARLDLLVDLGEQQVSLDLLLLVELVAFVVDLLLLLLHPLLL